MESVAEHSVRSAPVSPREGTHPFSALNSLQMPITWCTMYVHHTFALKACVGSCWSHGSSWYPALLGAAVHGGVRQLSQVYFTVVAAQCWPAELSTAAPCSKPVSRQSSSDCIAVSALHQTRVCAKLLHGLWQANNACCLITCYLQPPWPPASSGRDPGKPRIARV